MHKSEAYVDPVRSANMAKIRGKDTKPELSLRSELWRQGFRYRINYKIGSIKPDIVFTKHRLAIFVDGCFWHGCPIHYVRPKTRSIFWASKLLMNIKRDRTQTIWLESNGWVVLRFWEHEIRDELGRVVLQIKSIVNDRQSVQEQQRMVVCSVELIDNKKNLEKWVLEDLRDPNCMEIQSRHRKT